MTGPGDEVELLSDGDGITVYGNESAIAAFLASRGLLAQSRELRLHRLGSALRRGEAIAKGASEAAANSARWLKITPESAQAIKDIGLVETKTPGVGYAMVGKPGDIAAWIKTETRPGTLLTNPAILSGVAGVMGQLAGQSEMAEIKAYLVTIDIKLEDILNAQKNVELSKILGASRDIESAMGRLEAQGYVDATTWDTVNGRQETISNAQHWALLELGRLADKLDVPPKMRALAQTTESIAPEVRTLHVVLAHSLKLQEAYDVLRLSRVQEVSPELLDEQRLALKAERERRHALLDEKHDELLARMVTAAGIANSKALLHRPSLRAVVDSTNGVAAAIDNFNKALGIESVHVPMEQTRWRDAARSPQQLKTAGAEIGVNTAKAVVVTAALGLAAVAAKKATGEGEDGSA